MGAIAESMRAYAQPLIDETDGTPEQINKALDMAQLCWKLALLPEVERAEYIQEMRPMLKMDDEEFKEFQYSFLIPMITRHKQMFPQMHGQKLSKPATSGKIGRNSPCPCGSGKKFKKCCIDKASPEISETIRGHHWHLVEVEGLETKEIIDRLKRFGVDFDEGQFKKDVQNFYSAEELADHWKKRYTITARHFDSDFIWMACMVLWKRLAPDVIGSEQLSDLMSQGYELVNAQGKDRVVEGCKLWLQVWEHLKQRFTSEMKTLEDAENVFSGMQSLFNWCQDLEQELYNAGLEDQSFFHRRIEYCREFCSFFPDSREYLISNMKIAEAESYFKLGMVTEADQAFKALTEEFPDNVWVYIRWGDMYCLDSHAEYKNMAKAREIYQMALKIDSKDSRFVTDRLKSLTEDEQNG